MLRFHLDSVTRSDAEGWVFDEGGASIRVEAWSGSRFLGRASVVPRPDVSEAYPSHPNSLQSGFSFQFEPSVFDRMPNDINVISFHVLKDDISTKFAEAAVIKSGALEKAAKSGTDAGFALSPFPLPVMRAVGNLFPVAQGQHFDELKFVDHLALLIRWASESSLMLAYVRYLISVWSHCQFVARYFPVSYSTRCAEDKDFRCQQTTELELMAIAHQLYVLKSYGISGDFAEFGCFKGFSTAVLSYACSLIGVKMHVFDSFEGLPPSKSTYYSAGDFKGDFEEVKENVTRYGNIGSVAFHKGFFSQSLKQIAVPNLMMFWMDVDLESSAHDVMSVVGKLNEKGNVFSHECNPSNFIDGMIVAERRAESVIPPIVDAFASMNAPLNGRFIFGNTGVFWRANGGCPALGADALKKLISAL